MNLNTELKRIKDYIANLSEEEFDSILSNCGIESIQPSADSDYGWKMILSTFARKFDNIKMIYTGQCETGKDIIIIVDNICSDEVFQYNDFCFELMDDFSDIGNFMIFDEAEFEGMEYKNYTKMYQKG